MGGKEGPRSAVHVEGGPAASRAGGTCGHSAVGNGQLAGACSTLGREAPLLAGVSRAPGVGSGRAPAPVAGRGGSQRQAVVVCPSTPTLVGDLPGPAGPASWAGSLRASLQGRTLPLVRFPVSHPGTQCLLAGEPELGVRGPAAPARGPGAGVGVGVVAAPPKPVSLRGARVPLRLGGDRPASQPPWGRGCRSLPSGVQPRLSVRLLGRPCGGRHRTSFLWGPPFPPPRDASLAAPAPAPSALCGRGGASWGLPSTPRKCRPPLGVWFCQSDAGTLGVLLGRPPSGGFVGLPPTLRPACPAALHHSRAQDGALRGLASGAGCSYSTEGPRPPLPKPEAPGLQAPPPRALGPSPLSSPVSS